MESRRILQISENGYKSTPDNLTMSQKNYIGATIGRYREYLQLLGTNFFTNSGHTDVQDAIIRNNFGEDIDILSFQETALNVGMTPQSYAFLLHVAIHSGLESFTEMIRAYNSEDAEEFRSQTSRGSKKKSKKGGSKQKKSKKSKKKAVKLSDSEDSEESLDELMRNVDSDNVFDDDRELNINRPMPRKITCVEDLNPYLNREIAETSGSAAQWKLPITNVSNPNITSTEMINPIDVTPQPQQDKQLEEKISSINSSKKNKKSKTNQVHNVITGHEPTGDGTPKVREILVYDIPASWTPEDILKQLTLWGKTISMQTKHQRKYQTLRLKIELSTFRLAQFEGDNSVWTTDLGGMPVRWFPARWTLKERKEREKFQAVIRKIPDSMTLATLWSDQHPHSFLTSVKGLRSFKIIQTAKGERKLIGYFEKWIDMRAALDNQYVWGKVTLSWNRHAPPMQRTRSQGANADKNRRTSESNKSKSQLDLKKSKKKPEETKSAKPPKQKKDKSRDKTKEKILAEIMVLLRKII